MLDAVVIGSGPNGWRLAITLARAGHSVVVYEAQPTIGGGTKSAEFTLPGFIHDVCSAVHPMGIASHFSSHCRWKNSDSNGFIRPPRWPIRSTMDRLSCCIALSTRLRRRCWPGRGYYHKWIEPLVEEWPDLKGDILGPIHWPKSPMAYAALAFPRCFRRVGWRGHFFARRPRGLSSPGSRRTPFSHLNS